MEELIWYLPATRFVARKAIADGTALPRIALESSPSNTIFRTNKESQYRMITLKRLTLIVQLLLTTSSQYTLSDAKRHLLRVIQVNHTNDLSIETVSSPPKNPVGECHRKSTKTC